MLPLSFRKAGNPFLCAEDRDSLREKLHAAV